MVCKRWKALDQKRGENKDKIISEYVHRVKDFSDVRVRRMIELNEQRDLYALR